MVVKGSLALIIPNIVKNNDLRYVTAVAHKQCRLNFIPCFLTKGK